MFANTKGRRNDEARYVVMACTYLCCAPALPTNISRMPYDSRDDYRVANDDLNRCQGIYRNSARRPLPPVTAHKRRRVYRVMVTLSGLVASRRWMRRFGPNQKQLPWCSTSLAKVYRRKVTGNRCNQVISFSMFYDGDFNLPPQVHLSIRQSTI